MKDGKYEKKKGTQGKNASLSNMFQTLEKKSVNWTDDDWKRELSGSSKSKSNGKKSSDGGKNNSEKKSYSGKTGENQKSSQSSSNRSDKKDSRNYKTSREDKDGLKNKRDFKKQDGSKKINGPESKVDQGSRKNKKDNKSACKYMKDCGGCNVLEETYEEHLARKQKSVEKLLNKFARVEPIIGMEHPFYYRNKVHVVFDHDRKGNPISGLYEENTHRVIPIEKCMIHNEKADEIINTIRGMLKSFKIKTYDEDTGYGLLRHVLIRTGLKTGEIMVVLVLSSPIFPSKNNFVKALRKEHPEITTIILNVNDKKTSMVLGEKEHVIYGKGYIEDILCDKTFHISPQSFYQVNPVQTEILYNKGIEFAKLNGSETIIDAYCGIGTIGFIASDHVKRVIGVELNKDAVKDAIVNMKRNKITNAEVYNRDAGEFMRQAAEANDTKIDVVFMDPPRAGSDETFLNSVVTLNPEKVVYISCNPVTLERDLQYITKKGYRVKRIQPVDMFPWTDHVETVVLMSKVNTPKR